MQNKDYQKLRECPFCGGEAELHTELIFTGINNKAKKVYVVYCRNTKCIIGFSECGHYETKEDAINVWNTRTNNIHVGNGENYEVTHE